MRPPFIAAVDKLGDEFSRAWAESDKDLSLFPSLAESALRTFPNITPNYAELAGWIFRDEGVPLPLDSSESFGEPPITIYRTDDFVVDIYFWFSVNTSIHSHGFRGAFRVLQGAALEAEFSPRNLKDLDFQKPIHLDPVDLKGISVLRPGDVRRIDPQGEFIHEVCHCYKPQITLCLRTYDEEIIQHTHIAPNILFQQLDSMPYAHHKVLSVVEAAEKAGEADAEEIYRFWLESLPELELLAHHRKPQFFTEDRWKRIRQDRIREYPWGVSFLSAEAVEAITMIDFTKLDTPADRAVAFLLKYQQRLVDYETVLQKDFQMQTPLEQQIERLMELFWGNSIYAKRLNESAQELVRMAMRGWDSAQMEAKILSEYEPGLSPSIVANDLREFFRDLASDPLYRNLLQQHRRISEGIRALAR